MTFNLRQREMIQYLFREGMLSRAELAKRMQLSANSVSILANSLLERGVIHENEAEPSTGGRPRIPLCLDPKGSHVVGVSIEPGNIHAARINLHGHLLGKTVEKNVKSTQKLVPDTVSTLEKMVGPSTLAIGVSVPGFIDVSAQKILFSAVHPEASSIDLSSMSGVIEDRPLVLQNDMHALSARWLLTHHAQEDEDTLLVYIGDGALGSAVVVHGRPNKGCIGGGNELGHMRFPVETPRCYCGQTGCLERICSSEFLISLGAGKDQTLTEIVANEGDSEPVDTMMTHLASGLSNAINFIRPHRLVIVSPLTRQMEFSSELTRRVRSLILRELTDRVRIDLWDQPASNPGETAAWLAMAGLFSEGWQDMVIKHQTEATTK